MVARIGRFPSSVMVLVAAALAGGVSFAQVPAGTNDQREWAAVVEFAKDASVQDPTLTGAAVAVKLEQLLTGRYRLVTRAHIREVLQEQQLGLSDLADPQKARQFGKLVGARYLVTGSIVQIGQKITVAAQIFSVETGEIMQTAEIASQRVDELNDRIVEIARILPMTDQEKDVYLAAIRPPGTRPRPDVEKTAPTPAPGAPAAPPPPSVQGERQAPPPRGGWPSETRPVMVATPQGDVLRDIAHFTNSIGMKLVLVPPGEFMMGSPEDEADRVKDEGPQHKVRITKPFYMGAFEVTQQQYETAMGRNPACFKGAANPVEEVSWKDATEFCSRLSEMDGAKYRLPTEAEWEYACRAGSTTPFYFGRTISRQQANFDGRYPQGDGRKGEDRETTIPVGRFAPNAFGLYDMHGNVWEWCQDWYDSRCYANGPADDPQGPSRGSDRVVRGGSWSPSHEASHLRSAARGHTAPTIRRNNLGIRVVVGASQ